MRVDTKSNLNFYFTREPNIASYYEEVRKTPLLTQEEEHKLLCDYKNAKTEKEKLTIRNKLVSANLRFVISIAKKIGDKDCFLDCVNEGNLGLIKAIDLFDTTKNVRLITYAVSWIISFIQHFQYVVNKTVTPPNAIKIRNYVNNVTREFFYKNEREPQPDEVIEMVRKKFNFKIPTLRDVEMTSVMSIDEKLKWTDEDEHCFGDTAHFNSKTSSNNIDDSIDKEALADKVDRMLKTLTERERYVIEHTMGINCSPDSWLNIGKHIKVGEERVRQIYVGAINKLKYGNAKKILNHG